MVTAGILPFRENSHGRAGDRTRDLMISSQRLWPLDHEAGQGVLFLTDRQAPAQCSVWRTANIALYTAPLGTLAADDGSYTNDGSDNSIQEV